ncbi:hypothetical protein BKA65DRAFT_399466 [Rhexocercosporidium sp. MPI-PUGE-AT-0058]|nr:hypothetical protein BKA65DRAFT_399466 [Rhexocercosporidium sp. MPI-PUGE-AT-0058]
MDPLSALGIAAAVTQFLQFAGSLVSESRQMYTEGALVDHIECGNATKRLDSLAKDIQSSLGDLDRLGKRSNDAEALRVICVRCSKLSAELISQLRELEVDGKHRRWSSFKQALKSVCSKDKIEGIAAKLASCREELNQHLICSIRRKADSLSLQQDETLRELKENTRAMIAAILESRETMRKDLIRLNDGKQTNMCSSALVSLGEAQEVEIHLLLSLRFSSMRDRQAEIPIAHQKTFRWIFKDPPYGEEAPWSSFIDWLKTGEGIYWVNGKAGSGKSTLMRYIVENSDTRKYLQVWAGKHHLESQSFFFWNGGSLEQRSHCGLLRSLLHQALYKRPCSVRDIFPDEVAENNALLAQAENEKWNWTLPALKRAFQRWVNVALKSSLNLCIFLDGLDEYEGDHESIVDFFKEISTSYPSRIKLCISSRPWIVFDEAFKGLPKLRLQDLTYRDIEAYVHDELRSHQRMLQLSQAEPNHAYELATEIVTKASGVFLWVMLIIRSLLSGLRNRDDIAVLRKRLQHLPADLSSLYTHMLNHVDPLYNEQASQAFQIYGALSGESSMVEVTALEFSLAVTAAPHASASVTTPMTDTDVKTLCENLDVYLKSRCAGLLEIHQGNVQTWESWESYQYVSPVKPTHKVNYLHRTVKDFLKTEDVQLKMMKDCTLGFSPHTCVIHSCVTRLYRSVFITHYGNIFPASNEAVWATIVRAMKYAKCADMLGNVSYVDALAALEHAGKHAWNFAQDPWTKGRNQLPVFLHNTTLTWTDCDRTVMWTRNFVGEAIIHNLFAYIGSQVRESKRLLKDQGAMPLLSYIFQQRQSNGFDPPSPKMVALLLERGADPNQRWKGGDMLRELSKAIQKYEREEAQYWPIRRKSSLITWDLTDSTCQEIRQILSDSAQVLKLFLEYDANTVDVSVDKMERRAGDAWRTTIDEASILKIISSLYDKYMPSMSAELSKSLGLRVSQDRRRSERNGIKRRHDRDDTQGPRKRLERVDYWGYQR